MQDATEQTIDQLHIIIFKLDFILNLDCVLGFEHVLLIICEIFIESGTGKMQYATEQTIDQLHIIIFKLDFILNLDCVLGREHVILIICEIFIVIRNR